MAFDSSRAATVNDAPEGAAPDYQFLIIGAGVCGLYQLHRLLQLGAKVAVLEMHDGLVAPGGNRYPGCRFDSESYTYAYSFSKELLEEWDWSERFAAQPETLSYLNHVADKFDLRKHIQFGCTVVAASYEEDKRQWVVELADGRRLTTRFLMTAMGLLSVPTPPRFANRDAFEGSPSTRMTGRRRAWTSTANGWPWSVPAPPVSR